MSLLYMEIEAEKVPSLNEDIIKLISSKKMN